MGGCKHGLLIFKEDQLANVKGGKTDQAPAVNGGRTLSCAEIWCLPIFGRSKALLQWGRALSCAEMAIIGTVEFSMSCPAGRERSCKNHSAVQPWLRTLVRSTKNFQHFIPVREDTAFCTSPWRSHSLRHENRIVCDFLDRSILRASASGFPEDGGNSHDN